MYKITIVGLGPAGILMLGLLPDEAYKDVLVLEPNCVGGDLAAYYGEVVANLTRRQMEDAVRSVPRWAAAQLPAMDKYPDGICPKLCDVMRDLRALIAPELRKVTFKVQRMTRLIRTTDRHWKIETSSETVFETQKVILCTGAKPRVLDYPMPSIPLHIALDSHALFKYISPENNVILFGTAHSGALILKNLRQIQVQKVTAIYGTERPFLFHRDGVSEGLKQEAATIADEILSGAWREYTPSLVHMSDTSSVVAAADSNTYVIYSCGFEKQMPKYINALDNSEQLLIPKEGRFMSEVGVVVPDIYGFGIGFPSSYTGPDGVKYPDVGFAGFITAIKHHLDSILL